MMTADLSPGQHLDPPRLSPRMQVNFVAGMALYRLKGADYGIKGCLHHCTYACKLQGVMHAKISTQRGRLTNICVSSKLGQYCFREWLGTEHASSHNLTKWSLIVYCIIRNTLQWNLNKNDQFPCKMQWEKSCPLMTQWRVNDFRCHHSVEFLALPPYSNMSMSNIYAYTYTYFPNIKCRVFESVTYFIHEVHEYDVCHKRPYI